jgi:hypothetical protein
MGNQQGSTEVHGPGRLFKLRNPRHFGQPSLLLPHQPEAIDFGLA